MKRYLRAFALMFSLIAVLSLLFACAKKPADKNDAVVASIGDQKITIGVFNGAFTSYADYYTQMGMDPYASKSDLEYFQDMVLEAVLNDALVLHHASEEGFTLTAEQKFDAEQSAASELEQVKSQLMSQAEQLYASDPSKTIEQYFESLIGDMAEYYTGSSMSFENYCEEYKKQSLDTALVSAYKAAFESDISVSDAEIAEWYEKQLESDKKMYSEDAGKYLQNASEFEAYGEQHTDVYPPTYVPEGYLRIFDITVCADGELSEEYKSLTEEMDKVSAKCSDMLFSDALNGTEEHAEEILKLVEEYKVLKAQADEMYEEHLSSARKKIEEAYALLEDGEDFVEVMKRFTEVNYSESEDGSLPQRVIENGELISLTSDCGENDWSATLKEVCGMTAKGEYSSIFADEDGSLHIIMRGDDVPSGAVDQASIRDAIVRIVRSEKSPSAWQCKLDEWREDPALKIDMDTVRSVGADKLPSAE
ncbi:MAG: SurA N-terminal domain-containing protein [Clostridia bacterium]|nr:SurA N-terminal domain-containing protein [Clostridia bacterium]